MIIEPNASRGDWPLGRVLETFPGPNALTRVVRVRAKGKEYIRPVYRLDLLGTIDVIADDAYTSGRGMLRNIMTTGSDAVKKICN